MLDQLSAEFFVLLVPTVMLISKDLVVGFLKRKLNRRDIEVGALLDKYEAIEKNEIEISKKQDAIIASEQLLMRALNNFVQGAKLPPAVKDYSMELAQEISLILKDVAFENVDEVVDAARDNVLDRVRETQVFQDLPQSTKDLITEEIPETIRKFISE